MSFIMTDPISMASKMGILGPCATTTTTTVTKNTGCSGGVPPLKKKRNVNVGLKYFSMNQIQTNYNDLGFIH